MRVSRKVFLEIVTHWFPFLGKIVGNVGFHVVSQIFSCRKPEVSLRFPNRGIPETRAQ